MTYFLFLARLHGAFFPSFFFGFFFPSSLFVLFFFPSASSSSSLLLPHFFFFIIIFFFRSSSLACSSGASKSELPARRNSADLLSIKDGAAQALGLECCSKFVHLGACAAGTSQTVMVRYLPHRVGVYELGHVRLYDNTAATFLPVRNAPSTAVYVLPTAP